MTWPPADTDRNRSLYALGTVLAALAAVYFLLWALQSRGLFPWAGFTLLLAAALVAGLGLLTIVDRRRGARRAGRSDAPAGAEPAAGATTGSATGSATGAQAWTGTESESQRSTSPLRRSTN